MTHCGKLSLEVMSMIKKALITLILLMAFLSLTHIAAKGSPCAEIYDPAQKKVIKSVQVDSELYDLAADLVRSIDNFYGRISPAAVEGYKIRVPLDPPVKVNKKSLKASVSEVYIIVPQNKTPFLIIFEDKNKPSYFKFHGNIDSLWKALDFEF
jgi:hypothetical protein